MIVPIGLCVLQICQRTNSLVVMGQCELSDEFTYKCYIFCTTGERQVVNVLSITHDIDGVPLTRIAGQTFDGLTIDRHTGEILFVFEPRNGLPTLILKKTDVYSRTLIEVTRSHDLTGVRSLIPCRETESYIILHRNANNSCISLFSIASSRRPTVTIYTIILT